MTHYFLSPKDSRHVAVAFFPSQLPPSYALLDPVPAEVLTLDALPFDLVLKQVTFSKHGPEDSEDLSGLRHPWADYQPNTLAWPVVSARLRALIDRHACGREGQEWVRVTVRPATGPGRSYYLLRFTYQPDVLNEAASVFHPVANRPALLVKPVFAPEKIAGLSVFGYPSTSWQIPSGLCISREVKEAAKQEGLEGLHFEDLRIF
ncbi:imm11 family protein [Hymenobacter negativus]|uniref:Immunity MXAN-0049 protein domain-containing protein n=1 Tax=Hymenobacter negativus TaxID=2795026 RepID=A0ABS3QHU2_9BACT|nr:DUF1629 domain-containing protein [Hymenobacter negativus]MBO2010732.1 hypothetical protein [Hymenobacter negativus]